MLRKAQHHTVSKRSWTQSYFLSPNHDVAHLLVIQWPRGPLTKLVSKADGEPGHRGLRGRREKCQAANV